MINTIVAVRVSAALCLGITVWHRLTTFGQAGCSNMSSLPEINAPQKIKANRQFLCKLAMLGAESHFTHIKYYYIHASNINQLWLNHVKSHYIYIYYVYKSQVVKIKSVTSMIVHPYGSKHLLLEGYGSHPSTQPPVILPQYLDPSLLPSGKITVCYWKWP